VLATAAVDAARRLWPQCSITFVVKDEYSPVLDQNPHVARIVSPGPEERGVRGTVSLGAELRREGVDLVLDLQGGLRGRVLAALIRPRRSSHVNSRVVSRRLMTLRPTRWRRKLPHAVERYLECLAPWAGGEVFTKGPRIHLTDLEISRARAAVSPSRRVPLVGLAPGAKWRTKRWPERYFAALADELADQGMEVVLLGSAAEEPLLERIVEAVESAPGVGVLSGGIRELASAFSLCSVAVCNDSGLMHVAAAAGAAVVGIFGPTAPHFGFTPYGPGHEVVWLGLPCSPCSPHGDRPCRIAENAPCLEGVDPQRIVGAVRRILRRRAAVGREEEARRKR